MVVDKRSRIPAKAYLGEGGITEIKLSPQITDIGDWAFYHMSSLKTIWIPDKKINLGRNVFAQCGNLRQIMLYNLSGTENVRTETEGKQTLCNEGITRITSCGVVKFNMELPTGLPTDKKQWLMEYDNKLLTYLSQPENTGYEPAWFGGEEDYNDTDTNEIVYIANERILRAELIYTRLIENACLSDDIKQHLQEHLRSLMTEEGAALQCIIRNHPDELEYVREFLQAGCMTMANADEIMCQAEDVNAELRGYLLAYKQKMIGTISLEDLFSF